MVISGIKITPDPRLAFHASLTNVQQQVPIVIKPLSRRALIIVNASPAGSPFSWSAISRVVEADTELHVLVTFTPADSAPVQTTMIVGARNPDAFGTPSFRDFPLDVEIAGNTSGVGPGTLAIAAIVPDPPGPDLDGEVVFITNVSSRTLDLGECSFGDLTFKPDPNGGPVGQSKEQPRLRPDRQRSLRGITLRPFATSGDVLKIWTGAGPTPPIPLECALDLDAPIWNNTGDTAWIRNEYGQLIAAQTYVTSMSRGPRPAGAILITTPPPNTLRRTTVRVTGFSSTGAPQQWTSSGVSVEDGDLLIVSALGDIAVGFAQGISTPTGRAAESAEDDWPLPNSPKYGLIGRIGAGGAPFFVGVGGLFPITGLDAPATLWLTINDSDLGDNWGPGYTCTVTVSR